MRVVFLTIFSLSASQAIANDSSSLLDQVKVRGYLKCGVTGGTTLQKIDPTGKQRGFFAEYCHVLAAAIFGNKDAVKYVSVNGTNRFTALDTGMIDVLMSNTTHTVSRDSKVGLSFTSPLYYDGQGFLAYKNLGAKSLSEVKKAKVCTNRNTTSYLNVKDLAETTMPGLEIISFDTNEAYYSGFAHRRCDIMTDDRLILLSTRLQKMPNPDELVVFPDVLSKEPLSFAIKQGDSRWFDVVQWSIYATLTAEELGLNSQNINGKVKQDLPKNAQRLLGLTGTIGPDLGLQTDWAANIISQVGNYGEIFVRYFGSETDRGLNNLWTNGGLMYSPPFR